MQTFLPYPDLRRSMQVLDRQRLGKQRAETKQLLMALLGMDDNKARRNHPACVMWEGREWFLAYYGMECAAEWIRRGYQDTTWLWFWACREDLLNATCVKGPPWWFGLDEFHSSHRANLIRKLPAHYLRFGWIESSTVEYVWPSPEEGVWKYGT